MLQQALGTVVLVKLDGDDPGNRALMRRYKVKGYPTFLVVDRTGRELDRWSGFFDPRSFADRLERATNDPTPPKVRRARLRRAPTAWDAEVLGDVEFERDRPEDAITLYRRALELGSTREDQVRRKLLYASAVAGSEGDVPYADVKRLAEEIVDGSPDLETLVTVAQVMDFASEENGTPDDALPYLDRVAAAAPSADPADPPLALPTVMVAHAVRVEKDLDEALRLRREMLPAGWETDPQEMIRFARWCFQNEVALEEAESLALRAAELEDGPRQRQSMLDLAAKIAMERGNPAGAAAALRKALESNPRNARELRRRLAEYEKAAGS